VGDPAYTYWSILEYLQHLQHKIYKIHNGPCETMQGSPAIRIRNQSLRMMEQLPDYDMKQGKERGVSLKLSE